MLLTLSLMNRPRITTVLSFIRQVELTAPISLNDSSDRRLSGTSCPAPDWRRSASRWRRQSIQMVPPPTTRSRVAGARLFARHPVTLTMSTFCVAAVLKVRIKEARLPPRIIAHVPTQSTLRLDPVPRISISLRAIASWPWSLLF